MLLTRISSTNRAISITFRSLSLEPPGFPQSPREYGDKRLRVKPQGAPDKTETEMGSDPKAPPHTPGLDYETRQEGELYATKGKRSKEFKSIKDVYRQGARGFTNPPEKEYEKGTMIS